VIGDLVICDGEVSDLLILGEELFFDVPFALPIQKEYQKKRMSECVNV
jgi:hypothetical protein